MDSCLRCNALRCRVALTERAVVTTCSHIFCLPCAGNSGLSHSAGVDRQCPACGTSLLNPDDAVETLLNPTEDYKTSVLSGLDPNTIMECAGRALAFWTYQTTQEIIYQAHMAKAWTDKYGTLNKELDQIVHRANSEISALQQKVSDLQLNQDELQKKNQELVEMYKEKSKKHQQITNLYNLLKSRAMRSTIQTAASETVTQTLESLGAAGRTTPNELDANRPLTSLGTASRAGRYDNFTGPNDVEQLHRHQRSGSGRSGQKPQNDLTVAPPSAIPLSFRNAIMPSETPQHRTRLPQPANRSVLRGSEQRQYSAQHSIRSPNRFTDLDRRTRGVMTELPMSRGTQFDASNYGFGTGARIGGSAETGSNNANMRLGTFSTSF